MQLRIVPRRTVTDVRLGSSNLDYLLKFPADSSKLPTSRLSALTLNPISPPSPQQLLPAYRSAACAQSRLILQTLAFSYPITDLPLIRFLSLDAESPNQILKSYNVIQNGRDQNPTHFSFTAKIFLNVVLSYGVALALYLHISLFN